MKANAISPCLWLDDQAEEAAQFYTGIFPDSEILERGYYTEEGVEFHGKPAGSVMTVLFRLNGYDFTTLNGGPQFKFTEAISLVVNCETQAEVDEYWEKLSAGGQKVQCGWVKDKFGLSWQIVPTILKELLKDDPEKSNRVMQAVMKMTKLDIAQLQEAYEGKGQ